MAKSSIYEIPFPEDKDAPNGPAQMGAIAEAVDAAKWLSRSLKPTIGYVTGAGADFELTKSYADLGPSVTLTPAVPSKMLVIPQFKLRGFGSESKSIAAQGTVRLDSTDEGHPVETQPSGAQVGATPITWDTQTLLGVWLLTLTAAEHTIKLRVKESDPEGIEGGNAPRAYPVGSGFFYALFAS